MKKLKRIKSLWRIYLELDCDEREYEKTKLYRMKIAILDEIEAIATS